MATLNDHIRYVPGFIAPTRALTYFDDLTNNINWHYEVTRQDGSRQPLKRGMAYASSPATDYHYAGLVLPGQEWTPTLLEIKDLLSDAPGGYRYNSVLLNQYRHGRDVIQWHSDREEQLGANPVIATVNLGASRTFHFRDKETDERHQVLLHHGDLLLMLEHCQTLFQHAILKEPHINAPRISLTYRLVHDVPSF